MVFSKNPEIYQVTMEDGEVPYGTSIAWLLSQISLSPLAKELEKTAYTEKVSRHFHYDVELMLKLTILIIFRQIPYRKVQFMLTKEDLSYLLPSSVTLETFPFPGKSTIHNFIKTRLGEEGVKRLQVYAMKELLPDLKDKSFATIDSTPIEASRYDHSSPFHPFYRVRMMKCHILQVEGFPLLMLYSQGLAGDNPYALPLLDLAQQANLSVDYVAMDKGYDAHETYAAVYEFLGARPIIPPRENAVLNNEGTEEGMNEFIVENWREGGNIHAPMAKKLQFFRELRQKEMKKPEGKRRLEIIESCDKAIGFHFRNQYVKNPEIIAEFTKKRSQCERCHSHMKSIVNLTVRGIRSKSKEFYVTLNFAVFQILILAHFKLGIQNNNFGNYI